jgi:RES domain-containing protein
MIRAWRLTKAEHANDAFAGEGARRGGGRWNSKGVRVVYASGSLSLAALEVMVHTHFYSALKDFDPGLSQSITIEDLSDTWKADPIPQSLKNMGDRWIYNQESVILKVPSVIIPVEYNYLINPSHPDFEKVVIHSPQKFAFDPRLLS